eukprot:46673-Eustigmatos_ZCMA.PRE.1
MAALATRLVTDATKTQIPPIVLFVEHAPVCFVLPRVEVVPMQRVGALLWTRLARHAQVYPLFIAACSIQQTAVNACHGLKLILCRRPSPWFQP